MNENLLFGATSVICFLLPVAVIIYYRLYRHASLIALCLYYILTVLHSLAADSIPPLPDFKNTWEVAYNYMEIPLMLTALLFFCKASSRQQAITSIIGLFTIYELVILCLFGVEAKASVWLMVPGLAIIVGYSVFLFVRQLRFTLMHHKNGGRVLMLGAILFSYTCYLLVFYSYFIKGSKNIAGIYNLHYVTSTIAAVLMTAGLMAMRHRIRSLQELKVTRRELELLFN